MSKKILRRQKKDGAEITSHKCVDGVGKSWNMDHFSLVLMKAVASYQNERTLSLERKFSHLCCPEQKDSTALSLTCSVTVTS